MESGGWQVAGTGRSVAPRLSREHPRELTGSSRSRPRQASWAPGELRTKLQNHTEPVHPWKTFQAPLMITELPSSRWSSFLNPKFAGSHMVGIY